MQTQTIKFHRNGKEDWEYAYGEDHLKLKLGNDEAEVVRPARPSLLCRIMTFFSLSCW